MLRFTPNSSTHPAMYVRKKALLSAQIEGGACAFDDILDPANSEPVKKDGFNVVSYVMATDFALESPRVAFALQIQHAAVPTFGLFA